MKNVDSVDQDQPAQNVQSDLNLHCPQKLLLSSSVRKDLTPEKQNDILGLLTNVHTYRNMKPGFPSITQIVLFFCIFHISNVNPLPLTPIFGSSNSAANENMMS